METSGDIRVFFVLVPVFVFVGGWLFMRARRRSRMLADFARRHAFTLRPETEEIEARLNHAFMLDAPLIRVFSRVRDVVDAGNVQVFRVTELVDRHPTRQVDNSHFGRIAALFETPENADVDVLIKPDGVINMHPENRPPREDPAYEAVDRVIADAPPRNPLSVTFRRGRGLAYFQPLVVGGETLEDVEYLYSFADRVAEGTRSR